MSHFLGYLEDNLKNEDNLKKADDLKNEDNLKNKWKQQTQK